MSRSRQMRNAVLKLAASTSSTLAPERPESLGKNLAELIGAYVESGSRVLVLGGSTHHLVSSIATAVRADSDNPVVIVEPYGVSGHYSTEDNLSVLKGDLCDLRTDGRLIECLLNEKPISTYADLRLLLVELEALSEDRPLITAGEMDTVLMDFCANSMERDKHGTALRSAMRVMNERGHLISSVFVCDEPDSGIDVVSGINMIYGNLGVKRVPTETEFLQELSAQGFHGISVLNDPDIPCMSIKGLEIRLFVTVAYKGTYGACWDQGHAVIYKGPWSEVADDDGHRYPRGVRMAVCEKTYNLLGRAPYKGQFIGLTSYHTPRTIADIPFDCNTPLVRDPKVTKGQVELGSGCCETTSDSANSGSCC